MTRRMDAVTFNYVVRLIALLLAVVLQIILIFDAVHHTQPVDKGKVIGLAVGIIMLVCIGSYMILNPPE
jgi:hypothetical protein